MNRLFVVVFLFFAGTVVMAQSGGVKGKVVDHKTKQPLTGANVILIGTEYGAATDAEGYFEIKNVPENIYKVSVKYIGYNEHIEPDIRVIRGKVFFTTEIELHESTLIGDEVVVESGYFSQNKEMPVSYFSMTKDEIVRTPGAAGDIFRAIENMPGVSSSGGEFSAFSVRGSRPKDNIILIDNIPFATISHFTEASGSEDVEGGRFSIFSTGLIEKAAFQAGGFSAKYGGKFSSFLDLTLKEGNRESYSINGSYDLFGWEANYDGKSFIHDNTSLRINARAYDFERLFKMMDEIGHGHPKMSDYIMKSTTEINPYNKISLIGIYSTESSLRNTYHIYEGEDFDDRDMRDETEDKYLGGINWRFLPSENSLLNTSVYYSRTDTRQAEGRAHTELFGGVRPSKSTIVTRFPIGVYDGEQDIVGVKSDFTQNFGKNLTLNTGINVQQIKYKSNITMTGVDTLFKFDQDELPQNGDKFLIIDPDVIGNVYNKDRNEISAYSEVGFQLTNRLYFNTGLRFEYDDLTEESYVSPRLSGIYTITPNTTVNFAFGIYQQLPDMLQLSADSRNTKLKNEKAIHYILGLTHYIGNDFKFTAEGYYQDKSDLIVRPNSNDGLARNSGEGYAYGVDLSLVKKFVSNFYGQVSYSWGVSKQKDESTGKFYNITFNQPHIFNVLMGYQLSDRWSFTAKWKYASGRPKDEFVVYSDVLNDPARMRYSQVAVSRNTARYADFHTLNVRVDYRYQFTRYFAVTAFLDIMNLYDNNNYYSEVFSELTGKIEGEGMSMLPTLGFKVEI